jgi:hypothetical protein
MGAPEDGWDSLRLDRDFGGLTGGGFVVRARTQGRPDELWLNMELPDGSWSYVVLRDGTVVANERAESKRQAYMRTVEAVAHVAIG